MAPSHAQMQADHLEDAVDNLGRLVFELAHEIPHGGGPDLASAAAEAEAAAEIARLDAERQSVPFDVGDKHPGRSAFDARIPARAHPEAFGHVDLT